MAQASALPAPPLDTQKTTLAAELIRGLDASALQWLSGYMAGAAAQASNAPAAPVAQVAESPRLTVLYGSQTGNAKRVAEELAERAEADGLAVRLVRADAYALRELKAERLLYVVISTHSTGDDIEPPDDARALFEHLDSRRAPKLPKLRFAVLALGDSSYPDFCGIGRKLDRRLADLGATRLFERGDADVDVDSVAAPWTDAALEQARALREETATPATPNAVDGVVTPLHPARTKWTRRQPFHAEVLANQCIVAGDSGKDVRHIELSLEGSGITYRPGDALGVWPRQAPVLVQRVLEVLGLDAQTEVRHDEDTLPLGQWLGERRELTTLTRPFLAAHAERGGHAELAALLQPDARNELAELLASRQLIDVLLRWPVAWDGAALVQALRPLAPRMYSIASSQELVDEEVHLTVARLGYEHDGEERWGAASRYLCDLAEGDTVAVFVDANDRFRLPADPARDVIMIGPGTGVAPFRAFVQKRAAGQATGRTWLFFGNPHRRTDFLYQLEWQQALRDGALTRLSVAFSRDQADKLYVQHRLHEQGRDLWTWLTGGAHLFVCGDAERMAPDVHAALTDIVVEHGGKSRAEAEAWLQALMTEGRYARDVY